MQNNSVLADNKRLIIIMLGLTFLLLLPLLAGAPWTPSDYMIAAALLGGSGLIFELAMRKARTAAYKVAATLAIGTSLLLIWMNLAVGLIGNENNPVNLMYFGVVAIGLIGAGIARFHPRGMSRTLFLTALAQFLVPLIGMAIFRPPFSMGVVAVLGLNMVFVLLFFSSALLFQHAARSTFPATPSGSASI